VIEPLQRLLAADVLKGLTSRPLPELRDLRVRCAQVESDVSLARRVAQGRLDIVGHEVRRRAGDPDGTAVPGDHVASVLFELPDLMSDGVSGGSPSGRPVSITAPGEVALTMIERLDTTASPADLAQIEQLGVERLAEVFENISSFEAELSAVRRRLHETIDAIQAEIGRRYRDGEASVDSLLT
jgi:hypothetical protein